MNADDRALLAETLKNDKNPTGAAPDVAVRLLEETCARTGLDWKQRHIYLINRGGKWSVTVSIDGFRLIANQDPEYAGQEGPFWTMGPAEPWTDIPPDKTPYAAKVGVVRLNNGIKTTTWGVAKFADYNARSPMWTKFASTMIAKCAEMLALRKALPGRLGGLYGVEEMDQADAGKSARNSKSTKVGASVDQVTYEQPEDDKPDPFTAEIAACESLEQLKELGVKISKSNLGLKEKTKLSLVYNKRKEELSAGA